MAKKSFKQAIGSEAQNPAMAFLTKGEPEKKQEGAGEEAPSFRRGQWKHRTVHERGSEALSKRVQLLMKPSTHAAIKRLAEEQGKSTNALINEVMDAYVQEGANNA